MEYAATRVYQPRLRFLLRPLPDLLEPLQDIMPPFRGDILTHYHEIEGMMGALRRIIAHDCSQMRLLVPREQRAMSEKQQEAVRFNLQSIEHRCHTMFTEYNRIATWWRHVEFHKRVIPTIPPFIYYDSTRVWEGLKTGKEEECEICWDPMDPKAREAVQIRNCGHAFHRLCLYESWRMVHSEWREQEETCPKCRTPSRYEHPPAADFMPLVLDAAAVSSLGPFRMSATSSKDCGSRGVFPRSKSI